MCSTVRLAITAPAEVLVTFSREAREMHSPMSGNTPCILPARLVTSAYSAYPVISLL